MGGVPATLPDLRARLHAALEAHRNQASPELRRLLREYRALRLDQDPAIRAEALTALADLHVARRETVAALRFLADLAGLSDEDAKTTAAGRAAAILATQATDLVPNATPGNAGIFVDRASAGGAWIADQGAMATIMALCQRIARKALPSYERNRLEGFIAWLRLDIEAALSLVLENVRLKPVQLRDLLSISSCLLAWGHREPRFHDELARLVERVRSELGAEVGHMVVETLRLHIGDNAALFQQLGIAPALPNVGFLPALCDRGFKAFASDRLLWMPAGPAARQMRLATIGAMRRRWLSQGQPAGVVPRAFLLRAAQTDTFWKDGRYREETLDVVAGAMAGCDDGDVSLAKGAIDFLRGDRIGAYRHFDAALAADSGADRSGAAGCFLDFDRSQESAYLLNVDAVVATRDKVESALVCCADATFFLRYFRSYLASLRAVGSTLHVHCHIAAPTDEVQALIASIHDEDVSFSFEQPPLDVPAYYASMRFLRAPWFLDTIANRIVLTDIDVEFSADPRYLFGATALDNADVLLRMDDRIRVGRQGGVDGEIVRHPNLFPWSQINAACVGFSDSRIAWRASAILALDMAGHLHGALKRSRKAWWIDQSCLFHSYQAFKADGVRVSNVEDLGMPFGAFTRIRSEGGTSPVFSG